MLWGKERREKYCIIAETSREDLKNVCPRMRKGYDNKILPSRKRECSPFRKRKTSKWTRER